MSDCGCSEKVNSKKVSSQIVPKTSGNPGSCLCETTFWEGYGFWGTVNNRRHSYTFKPIATISASKIKFWLCKQGPGKPVPHNGVFYILDVNQTTGDPGIGISKLATASFDIPVGLSEAGQEFEVSFSSVNLVVDHLYGLCWEFLDCDYLEDEDEEVVKILINAGEDDTCHCGLSDEGWSQQYYCTPYPGGLPAGVWADRRHSEAVEGKWFGPSAVHSPYYCLGMMPLAVTTNACSNKSKTGFTANGEIVYSGPDPITIRGFDYGVDKENYESWSEEGSFDEGEFSHEFTGLDPGKVYWFRAFACTAGA